MNNLKQARALAVQSCGVTADKLLAHTSSFKVLAVFQRSVYLQACVPAPSPGISTTSSCFQPDIICLVDPALGNGPLHCCVAGFAGINRIHLKVGARLFNNRASRVLRLGADTELHYRHRLVPELRLQIPVCKSLAAGLPDIRSSSLQSLRPAMIAANNANHENSLWVATLDWLSATLSDDGARSYDVANTSLYQQGCTDWSGLLAGCQVDIHRLTNSTIDSRRFDGIVAMLGRGGGLTPSGDDFICGVIASFYLTGNASQLQPLRSVLLANLLVRTHLISAAHLHEACDGLANDASMAVVVALIDLLTTQQNNPATLADACSAMGASSGWDFLAGLVAALYLRLSRTDSSRIDSSRTDSLMDCDNSELQFPSSLAVGGKKTGESAHLVV